MDLTMKERNDEKAWAAYEKDAKILMDETLKKRAVIEEKYKDYARPKYGMDGDPEFKELGEVTKWFGREIKKLREKHGIS